MLLQIPSARRKYVVVVAGATVTLLPVPTDVPPQLPLYHLQLAPVDKVPPLALKVVFCPRQMLVIPIIDVAGTEESLTVKTNDLHTVVLQNPLASSE